LQRLRSRRRRRRSRFGRALFEGPVVKGGEGGHFAPRSDCGQHAVVVLNTVNVVVTMIVVVVVVGLLVIELRMMVIADRIFGRSFRVSRVHGVTEVRWSVSAVSWTGRVIVMMIVMKMVVRCRGYQSDRRRCLSVFVVVIIDVAIAAVVVVVVVIAVDVVVRRRIIGTVSVVHRLVDDATATTDTTTADATVVVVFVIRGNIYLFGRFGRGVTLLDELSVQMLLGHQRSERAVLAAAQTPGHRGRTGRTADTVWSTDRATDRPCDGRHNGRRGRTRRRTAAAARHG